MRNPWRKESYKGDWSDSSSKWTAALKKEVNLVSNAADGVFYMPLSEFKKSYSDLSINYDPSTMHSSYFLRLNDDGTGKDTKACFTPNAKCYKHYVTITSSVAQKVWIEVQTWDDRSLPKKCKATSVQHALTPSWDPYTMYAMWEGSKEFKPQSLTAG